MKKFLASALATIITVLCLTPCAAAATYRPSFEPSAQGVYMVNLDSNMVIYEKNAQAPVQPGSLAQLMTVILALEKVPNLASKTGEMKSYMQDEMYNRRIALGGKLRLGGLLRGDTVTLDKLLYAVMLPGANDAALMIADTVGDGSVPYFVEMMNQRAQELGALHTRFASPHGLPDPDATTTAYDMAIIAKHAMSLEGFDKLVSVSTYNGGPLPRIARLDWNTTNQFLRGTSEFYNPAITCVKESYIAGSTLGNSMVALAKKDGYTYLVSAMGCTGADAAGNDISMTAAFYESTRLFSWAFDTFRVKTLLEKGKSFEEIKLKLCWGKDFLRLMSADSFTALIPDAIESSSVQYELMLPNYVEAPIEKGQLVGEVKLILADEVIGRVGVVSAEAVEASHILMLREKLLSMTRTFWFKFIVVLLLVLVIMYVGMTILRNHTRRRYGGWKRKS
ncbi:MAG: serine hydrolase [Oscillospiraceae bacterium]